jgi:hypothetical protein
MSLSEELKELEKLYRAGTLTDDEYQLAKRRVLEESPVGDTAAQLEAIKVQNELAQLDRDWETEKESYLLMGRYGVKYIPRRGSGLSEGIVITIMGATWTACAVPMALRGNSGAIVAVLPFVGGVVLLLFGISLCKTTYNMAGVYQQAYERYQSRRSHLLQKRQSGV